MQRLTTDYWEEQFLRKIREYDQSANGTTTVTTAKNNRMSVDGHNTMNKKANTTDTNINNTNRKTKNKNNISSSNRRLLSHNRINHFDGLPERLAVHHH